MKALTLTQPWATLIAVGAKRIETRSWGTSYRGRIAIHAAKGFASINIVLGIGSFTYQYNTRDTFGFAMKATYGEVLEDREVGTGGVDLVSVGREIFKDPITDDGTKKSKKGLLYVQKNSFNGELECIDQVNWQIEGTGELKTVFLNGKLTRETTLDEIRNRLNKVEILSEV